MPELPEVESLRRGLIQADLRAPISAIWRSEYDLRTGVHWRNENLHHLEGGRPTRWTRRGKHLVAGFDTTKGPSGLLVHLGMSGKLVVCDREAPRVMHTHFILSFEDGRDLRFVDPRRFGGVKAGPWEGLWSSAPLVDLGVDALDEGFNADYMQRVAGSSQRALRDILLDQRMVAGIGNIYALEALFFARLHPQVAARRLRFSAWERLVEHVDAVLRQGVRNGGTTFRDYRGAHDEPGRNQTTLAVYGREGQACVECGERLQGFVMGGRSGVYCPRDQPRPRGRTIA